MFSCNHLGDGEFGPVPARIGLFFGVGTLFCTPKRGAAAVRRQRDVDLTLYEREVVRAPQLCHIAFRASGPALTIFVSNS